MVKLGNMVPCKYVSASPVALNLYEELFSSFRFVFPHCASDQLSPKYSASSKGFSPYLSIQMEFNIIWRWLWYKDPQ